MFDDLMSLLEDSLHLDEFFWVLLLRCRLIAPSIPKWEAVEVVIDHARSCKVETKTSAFRRTEYDLAKLAWDEGWILSEF